MSSIFRDRNFEAVGGLQEHIQTLKEMIIYPLLYRELFDSYGIQAPRGVLFYGPPGTGKTLMAGAVAAECSKCCSRKVAFYMRKGGECLNKYVGESEKHLQNLFTQAYSTRPSIIFFDEIDGLVPTRSETQEQVHASVVSTLLALMDGLDTKSEVFVIGATNRIDMIDPALRRPGRFDRELYFPLPPFESRLEIFKIHTNNWKHKPSENLMMKLAAECSGYCGADIQSLCSQAVMQSFSRSYPQVLDTTRKAHISLKNIHVKDDDFWKAKDKIVPASQRIYSLPSRPLSPELEPLLKKSLDKCIDQISKLCPFCFMYRNCLEFSKNKSLSCPRFLLLGKAGQAQISHIAPAILHAFDHLPCVVMDLTTINEDGLRNSESSSLVHKVEEARQSMPSIIYLRNLTAWWDLIDETAKQVLISSLESLDTSTNTKIFIFGSASTHSYEYLPAGIRQIFPKKKSLEMTEPTIEERRQFFRQILLDKNLLPPRGSDSSDVVLPEVVESEPVTRKRKYDVKAKGDGNGKYRNNQNHMKTCDVPKGGRLRNGKAFRQNPDDLDAASSSKKIKLEQTESSSTSINGSLIFLQRLFSKESKGKGDGSLKYKPNPNQSKSYEMTKGGRLRNGKAYRQTSEDSDDSCNKKIKQELSETSTISINVSETDTKKKEPPEVKIDISRLEKLVETAVKITSKARVNSLVRLYEELEIVSLRYSSKLDRSSLPEELEREISIFTPT